MKMPLMMIGLSLLLGCASPSAQVDYQAGTDFSQIRAFTLASPSPEADSLMAQRIRTAASQHLQHRGWQQQPHESSDGITLFYQGHIATRPAKSGLQIGLGAGSFGSSGGISGGVTIPIGDDEQQVLLVQLDMVQNGQLLWRGQDELRLRANQDPSQRNAQISAAVQQLLGQFPPTANK
ncbi:DUF4136 domain-containing protein [uncultured Ferrimonas sp.]|uniref:DUF4136 domain-containing protein n=1 Tax=uncultured Ferrimonas sp. TaxID=432640 RepID=UPI00262ABC6A|nr:DUF4136 domain-containing protein [uncultured Ferrimonas sp.]